ncbi:MAG: AAA family ATPase, partial [Clostridiales bacterium]
MIYIKSLKIENFQSHKETSIDFDKGLNVIIGASDNGKTAIIRAIKWVLYNEPRGLNFLRHNAKIVKVKINLSNNYSIIREKSKTKNRYILIDENLKENIFEGFGSEVPKEITNAHCIPKIKIDNDISTIINIGEQLESPFLLFESGSIRAKAIGRLTGVHVIDKALRDSINDYRKQVKLDDSIKKELDLVNTELIKYEYLQDYSKKIEKLEMIFEVIDKKQIILEKLESLYLNYNKNIDEAISLTKKIELFKGIEKCESLVNILNDKLFKLKTFSNLKLSFTNMEKNLYN